MIQLNMPLLYLLSFGSPRFLKVFCYLHKAVMVLELDRLAENFAFEFGNVYDLLLRFDDRLPFFGSHNRSMYESHVDREFESVNLLELIGFHSQVIFPIPHAFQGFQIIGQISQAVKD